MPLFRSVNSQLFITGGLLFVLVVIVLTVAGGPRLVSLGAQLSGSSSSGADMGACCPGPAPGQVCLPNTPQDDCANLPDDDRFFMGYDGGGSAEINEVCSARCNTALFSSSSSSLSSSLSSLSSSSSSAPRADLRVTLACTCGTEYSCVVTITNAGPDPAAGVEGQFSVVSGNLTIELPAPSLLGGLTIPVKTEMGTQVLWTWMPPAPSSSNASNSSSAVSVSSTPALLASGQSVTAKLQIIPGPMLAGAGSLTFMAVSDATDPNPSNSTVTLPVSGSMCPRDCGNSILELGEQCDDGNTIPTDGCSSACAVELGYECHPPVPQMTAYSAAAKKPPPESAPYPLCDCGTLPVETCSPPAP